MICLSFHSPDSVALSVDTEIYNLVTVFSDQDLINVKLAAHNIQKNRVLLISGVERLFGYARTRPNRVGKFKIIVFDVPHLFFQRKLEVMDATKVDGIWTPIETKNFSQLLKKTNKGTKEIV